MRAEIVFISGRFYLAVAVCLAVQPTVFDKIRDNLHVLCVRRCFNLLADFPISPVHVFTLFSIKS